MTGFTCRRATPDDADAIAKVFSRSFRLLTFLPMLHTVEEDRRFIADVILKGCEFTVAEVVGALSRFWRARGRKFACPTPIRRSSAQAPAVRCSTR
jgi:hypothetical protein